MRRVALVVMDLKCSDFPLAVFFHETDEECELDGTDGAGEVVESFVTVDIGRG